MFVAIARTAAVAVMGYVAYKTYQDTKAIQRKADAMELVNHLRHHCMFNERLLVATQQVTSAAALDDPALRARLFAECGFAYTPGTGTVAQEAAALIAMFEIMVDLYNCSWLPGDALLERIAERQKAIKALPGLRLATGR